MEYKGEQLNYFRICYIAFNLVPEGLRKVFKQEWDFRYNTYKTRWLGEWKDTPKNGLDFDRNESPKSHRKNARFFSTILNGNTAEWDCSCLFFAILYSDSIGASLSPVIYNAVDDLRQAKQLERGDYQHLQYGNFKAFFHHMLNISQVLASFDVNGYTVCAFECLANLACFSFNFAILADNSTGRHVCHLLASDKYNHFSIFVPSDEFHHYAIVSPCESFPCQNGGTCRPLYGKDSYLCNCPEGHNGTHCEKECQGALGMANGSITDEQINASSVYDANHAIKQGRLYFQETQIKSGAWLPAYLNQSQWLQIDLRDQHTKVTGVATQGRNYNNWSGDHSQWVRKYKLQYSDDGVTFQYYRGKGQSEDKEFVANTDRDSVVYHELNPPITARYIRFRPTDWNNWIAMRVELYGCKE